MNSSDANVKNCNNVSDDLLEGADQIAEFMLGDPSKRLKVYHLAEQSKLPLFKIGSTVCGRLTTLLQWIEDQERAALIRAQG